MLASHGRLDGLEATATLDPALVELQDLVLLRRRYVDECASLAHLERQFESKAALRLLRQALARRVKILEGPAGSHLVRSRFARVSRSPALDPHRRTRYLRLPAGRHARTRHPGHRASEALPVAPCARDSGSNEGDAISATDAQNRAASCYMAALTAIRRNPALATLHQHLPERGKQPELALVAVVCKLVTHADAPLRTSRL